MTILLKSHGLYSYVTGTTVAPTRIANESPADYAKRINEWDINNAKILGFINASTTAEINQQFLGYTTAKEMQAIRDHLNLGAPQNVRASLLHRHPLPSLEDAITELLSEETRLQLRTPASVPSESIFSTSTSSFNSKGKGFQKSYNRPPGFQNSYNNKPSDLPNNKPSGKPSGHECTFCHSPSHYLVDRPIRWCKHYGIQHPRHLLSECPQNPKKHQTAAKFVAQHETTAMPGMPVAAPVSTNPELMELMRRNQELMAQIMTGSLGMNSQHSTTSGTLWIFDSGCFNHMSPCPKGFVSKRRSSHPTDPKTKQNLGVGRRVGRVLEVVYIRIPLQPHTFAASVSQPSSLDLWHARLGHLSSARIKSLASSGSLGHVIPSNISCLPCKLGKHHALPFEINEFKSSCPFDLIHSNVWGPAPNPSMGGAQYFVIFIDDHTRFTWIYLMKHRSELPKLYIDFARMILTQFSKPIKILRADNAMEYKESSLLSFLKSQGTLSQYSCPGTSPQNGRAERKYRHILDTVRTLLVSAKCPERFWGEAAFTAVYTINRHPTPLLQNKSPYETLHGISPAYELLKVWGCACFVQLQPHERTKLEPRARVCLFLGYGIEHKGYRCWDPISKRLRISRHVTFWENVPFFTMPNAEICTAPTTTPFFTDPSSTFDIPISPPIPSAVPDSPTTTYDPPPPVPTPSPTPEAPAESTDPGPSTSDAVRRSDLVRQVPAHLRDYHCYATLLSNHEPTSYKEAASSSHWQKAIQEELRALAKAQTWDPVPLPSGKRPIGSKWVFKIKTNSDGSIDRYKARLMAKGFNQEYGIDYEETFAPVAHVTSVRNLLAIAATKRWPLFQMDVKNAFLNGDLVRIWSSDRLEGPFVGSITGGSSSSNSDLSEEVYMTPPGVSLPSGHVCRLRKALYGLIQAPRAWFEKFSNTVLSLGFSVSNYDSGLFTRTTDSGSILLLLYVDDMIITGDDSLGIASLKQSLSSSFEMKDLGKLHYFLGLEVLSDSSGTNLCQAKYISDLLSKADLSDNKVASTPLEHNLHLAPNFDIAYAVHTMSQFMAAPCSDHYAAVIRILRYLRGTMFHGLHFSSKSSLILRGYSDSD
ncbi:hypothetical protein OSB04_007174 [Centaurea solstitialis]|uniref:Integrase catalytic domain-containing protein n=1 Tax=Centaurea solstitialis TaxID=347529 RepID=A0AA38TL48_9ASTR|nr:hypothetical protein OSB04_007174 [Centaurea solstitialis]